MIIFCHRSATGEGWQEIMMACTNKPTTKCDPRSDESFGDVCGSEVALPYFISFYILCSFLVNSFILLLVLIYIIPSKKLLINIKVFPGMCAP